MYGQMGGHWMGNGWSEKSHQETAASCSAMKALSPVESVSPGFTLCHMLSTLSDIIWDPMEQEI